MNVKIIKVKKTNTAKNAEHLLKDLGWNVIKLSVNRRTRAKHKVIETIRSHKKYSENLNQTLLFEGLISILNTRKFWVGSPDFIIWNNEELYFCEFKSFNDNFRLNQLDWFERFDILPTAIAFAVLKEEKSDNE